MVEIGSIIYIEYLIFKDDDGLNIDHTRRRPCIIIGEDDEKYYLLKLSSYQNKNNANRYLKLPSYAATKECYIDLQAIYTTKIAGYKELNYLDEKDLINALEQFYKYQTTIKEDENFLRIKMNILNTIKKLLNETKIEYKKK